MKKVLVNILIVTIFLSLCSCSLFFETKDTSIKKDLKKHTIVDVRSYNSIIFVVTNFEVLRYSVINEILSFEQRGSYRLPKKSNFSDLSQIGILHIDEKLMVIQVNDYKAEKDTLYFIDTKTCQKISERVLDGYKRIVFVKTNPHELETSDNYYLLAVPGSNIGITLEKVSYINQQIKWSYSSRYSGWNLEGVLFVDQDKILLRDVDSDSQHYQINLINTQDGTLISQKLIEKSKFSNLRLTQVADRTFFIFDFTDTGATTSLWELKSDNTLIKKWSKVLEGVKRENIWGFANEYPYIYFIHQNKLSQDGTLWYLDLLKGDSTAVNIEEVPPEIDRSSPEFVISIGGKMFLCLTSIKPNTKLFNLSIFLIDQGDGSILWEKQNKVESYYDGIKGLIFGSKKTPFFVNGNTAAFIWNEDKVELINLSDGKRINLITKKGLYENFNASFFIQDQDQLLWLRDNGDYDFIEINEK